MLQRQIFVQRQPEPLPSSVVGPTPDLPSFLWRQRWVRKKVLLEPLAGLLLPLSVISEDKKSQLKPSPLPCSKEQTLPSEHISPCPCSAMARAAMPVGSDSLQRADAKTCEEGNYIKREKTASLNLLFLPAVSVFCL